MDEGIKVYKQCNNANLVTVVVSSRTMETLPEGCAKSSTWEPNTNKNALYK